VVAVVVAVAVIVGPVTDNVVGTDVVAVVSKIDTVEKVVGTDVVTVVGTDTVDGGGGGDSVSIIVDG
jgi:hypothetical protein